MLKVIDYEEKYVEQFSYEGIETELLKSMDIKKMIKDYAKIGNCWIALNDNKPITFAGIYLVHPGVSQGWILMNQRCSKHIKQITREVRKHIKDYMIKNTVHRLQTLAVSGNYKISRFLELLGFKKESTLKLFTSKKEDMDLHVIIELRRN